MSREASGGDWRRWLANRWGLSTLAASPPASALEPCAWFATPVSLLARLDHVQMSVPGIVRLTADEAKALAEDFARTFAPTDLSLHGVEGYEGFLVRGLAVHATTVDPARVAGSDIGEVLPGGPGARDLRRLGSEFELWLHDHPLNAARQRSNLPSISTLWIWGGDDEAADSTVQARPVVPEVRRTGAILLWCRESDAYASALAMRASVVEVVAESDADRAAAASAPLSWPNLFTGSMTDAARAKEWVAVQRGVRDLTEVLEAIEAGSNALRESAIERLTVFANDTVFRAGRWDLRKPWRRSRRNVAGLV